MQPLSKEEFRERLKKDLGASKPGERITAAAKKPYNPPGQNIPDPNTPDTAPALPANGKGAAKAPRELYKELTGQDAGAMSLVALYGALKEKSVPEESIRAVFTNDKQYSNLKSRYNWKEKKQTVAVPAPAAPKPQPAQPREDYAAPDDSIQDDLLLLLAQIHLLRRKDPGFAEAENLLRRAFALLVGKGGRP